MTDLMMLTKIKNDSDYSVRDLLWEKYQGKIGSSYYKNKKYYEDVGICFEDFKQEAFFAFLDCIEYINLEKMEASNASFGTSFYFFLLKIKNKSQREVAKMGIPIYLSEIAQAVTIEDPKASTLAKLYHKETAVDFQEELEKRQVQTLVQGFIKTQSKTKRQILEMYLADVSVKEISTSLQLKYTKVYSYVRNTKNVLSQMYAESLA